MQAEAEKPEESRRKKNCLAMKTLNLEQMENIQGGISADSTIGLLCGAAFGLAVFGGPLAILAVAPAVGCAVGLHAHFFLWD